MLQQRMWPRVKIRCHVAWRSQKFRPLSVSICVCIFVGICVHICVCIFVCVCLILLHAVFSFVFQNSCHLARQSQKFYPLLTVSICVCICVCIFVCILYLYLCLFHLYLRFDHMPIVNLPTLIYCIP